MELFLLPSSPLITLPSSSSPRNFFMEKQHFLSGQTLTFPNIKRYPDARKLKFPVFRAQASESVQVSRKSNSGATEAIKQEIPLKDEHLIFVAGATGKVGSRTVRELLKLGFRVRAGVRSAQRAETLVQSVRQMELDGGASAVEKLEIVECDLERDRIEPAIGNASVVICCIGASEKEIFDITGPYRIDYQASKNLIDAATVSGVNHFILLTSLGTNKIGFPVVILNLFWGVLVWKRKAEEVLIASGLPYTIVRPGGMERPTDAFKETHNISLFKEDTLFGGQVSNLQVAELIAFMTKNRNLSFCKVVEVIAETTAPLSPLGELLAKIPSQRVDSTSLKEPQTASEPDVVPPENIVPDATSSVMEEESTQMEVQSMRPLSPYFVYDDLKPPTSPTPTASLGTMAPVNVVQAVPELAIEDTQNSASGLTTRITQTNSTPVKVQEARPLSPYFVYEDLKPPCSPMPSPKKCS